jgi:hypothetical protein
VLAAHRPKVDYFFKTAKNQFDYRKIYDSFTHAQLKEELQILFNLLLLAPIKSLDKVVILL